MNVDLSACVAKIFAELDIDEIVNDITAPARDVQLTGRPARRPAAAPVSAPRETSRKGR